MGETMRNTCPTRRPNRTILTPVFASAFAFSLAALLLPAAARGAAAEPSPRLRRVSTVVPFPRGLVLKDGELFVLARGRVRDSGGVDVKLEDRAGSLWRLDPNVAAPLDEPGESATNGRGLRRAAVAAVQAARPLPTAGAGRFGDRSALLLAAVARGQ